VPLDGSSSRSGSGRRQGSSGGSRGGHGTKRQRRRSQQRTAWRPAMQPDSGCMHCTCSPLPHTSDMAARLPLCTHTPEGGSGQPGTCQRKGLLAALQQPSAGIGDSRHTVCHARGDQPSLLQASCPHLECGVEALVGLFHSQPSIKTPPPAPEGRGAGLGAQDG
jgi:hypothetical protein